MDDLFLIEIAMPLYQVMALLMIVTVMLLFGLLKTGLLCTYCFLFYWGNVFNIRSVFEHSEPHLSTASFAFAGFGLVILFLAMIGFLLHKK